jgi:hypothetical protein
MVEGLVGMIAEVRVSLTDAARVESCTPCDGDQRRQDHQVTEMDKYGRVSAHLEMEVVVMERNSLHGELLR